MIIMVKEEDPRYINRKSGVNVLSDVAEAWSEVRDNANAEVDWVIVGYEAGSKVNVTTLAKGRGGVEACSARLPALTVVFGGCKLRRNGRFVTFFHVDDDAPALLKGTALLHKNGIMNVLQGSDYEVKLLKNMTEEEVENLSCKGGSSDDNGEGSHKAPTPYRSTARTAPLPYTKSNKNTKGCSDDPKKSCNSSGPVAYALLKDVRDVNSLPSQVDPFRREQALSNREFEQVFGIKKEQFATLPAWRKASMKKAKGLF